MLQFQGRERRLQERHVPCIVVDCSYHVAQERRLAALETGQHKTSFRCYP